MNEIHCYKQKDAWISNMISLGIKKEDDERIIHRMASIDDLDDRLTIKSYIKSNPSESVFDFEEDQIEIDKFLYGDQYVVIYLEIDARYSSGLEDLDEDELKERVSEDDRFYWRKVKHSFV